MSQYSWRKEVSYSECTGPKCSKPHQGKEILKNTSIAMWFFQDIKKNQFKMWSLLSLVTNYFQSLLLFQEKEIRRSIATLSDGILMSIAPHSWVERSNVKVNPLNLWVTDFLFILTVSCLNQVLRSQKQKKWWGEQCRIDEYYF